MYQNCWCQKAFYCSYFSKLVSHCIYNLVHIYFFCWTSVFFYSEETNRSVSQFSKENFWSFLHFFIIMDICYLLPLKKNPTPWYVYLQSKSCALLFCSSCGRFLTPEWSVRWCHNVSHMIVSKGSSVLVMHKYIFTA